MLTSEQNRDGKMYTAREDVANALFNVYVENGRRQTTDERGSWEKRHRNVASSHTTAAISVAATSRRAVAAAAGSKENLAAVKS